MFGYCALKEMQQSRIVDRLRVNQLEKSGHRLQAKHKRRYLVDTTDAESKSTSFDTGAVHVIAD